MIGLIGLASLSACTATDGATDRRGDLLKAPQQGQTLGEQVRDEASGEGCLAPGNAGNRSERCRALRDVIAPPALPEPPLPPPRRRPQ